MPSAQSTIEQILAGTRMGSVQSVGVMDVLPIIDDGGAQDEGFGPPRFSAGTRNYGSVRVRNMDTERETIVPTGSGFVTREYAQDHAVPSAYLVGPGEDRNLDGAMCIQETQGGLIRQSEQTQLIVLPAALRAPALAMRNEREYSRLWTDIRRFLSAYEINTPGNLVNFLNRYEQELDQFVAEFELIPSQVGAIVSINGKVVGIERAPNVEYWEEVWVPLIRVCYGSMAIHAAQVQGTRISGNRVPLQFSGGSLSDLQKALVEARTKADTKALAEAGQVTSLLLQAAPRADSTRFGASIITAASENGQFAGQLVRRGELYPYVSISPARRV